MRSEALRLQPGQEEALSSFCQRIKLARPGEALPFFRKISLIRFPPFPGPASLDPLSLSSIQEGFTFNGNVHGNTFSAKEEQDKIYYHGGFFGPNAEELAGVLRHDDDKVNGYFGAHKQ